MKSKYELLCAMIVICIVCIITKIEGVIEFDGNVFLFAVVLFCLILFGFFVRGWVENG